MNSKVLEKLQATERRWDIDWLRILVVLLLIPYHTARIFDYEPFYIKNDQLTEIITYWFVRVGDAFAMELLFLLAGAATWFALKRRSWGRYAIQRIQRLLVPLFFGVFVLVPPIAYFAFRYHKDYQGSFLQFYPQFFDIRSGGFLDFTGGFTVAHLWFIFFLLIFSLLALPLFLFFKRDSGVRLIRGIARFLSMPGLIILLFLPLLILEWCFDLTQNLIFFLIFYLTFFIYGYILIADDRFKEAIDQHKRLALIFGPGLYIILGIIPNTYEPNWLGLIYYRSLFPWLTIIAAMGYAQKYLLTAPKRSLSALFLVYFGEASYPFYLLHLPVLVAIGYYVVMWNVSILFKYLVIVVLSYLGTILIYDFFVRRTNITRFLFGMAPRKQNKT